MSVTEEQLVELEELLRKATPGPWLSVPNEGCRCTHCHSESRAIEGVTTRDMGKTSTPIIAEHLGEADAALIAACRLAMPTLIAEVRKQRTKRAESLNAAAFKFDEVLERTKTMPLLDALSFAATVENERAVQQADRGVRNPHTGALWDTCFRYMFEAILAQHLDTYAETLRTVTAERDNLQAALHQLKAALIKLDSVVQP